MIVTRIYSIMSFFKKIFSLFIAIHRIEYKLILKRGSVNKNTRSRGLNFFSCSFQLSMNIQQLIKTKMSKHVDFILL